MNTQEPLPQSARSAPAHRLFPPVVMLLGGVAIITLAVKYDLGWRRAQFPELSFSDYLATIDDFHWVLVGVAALLVCLGLPLTIWESRRVFGRPEKPLASPESRRVK